MTASSEDLCLCFFFLSFFLFLLFFSLYPSLSEEIVMLVTSFSTLTSDFNPGGKAGPKPSSLEDELQSCLGWLNVSFTSLGGELDGLRGLLLVVLLFRASKSIFAKMPLAGSLERNTLPLFSSQGLAGPFNFSPVA